MIYANYRTPVVERYSYNIPIVRYDFSHLTLKEIDQEIERTIEQMEIYKCTDAIARSIETLSRILVGYSSQISNVLRQVGEIPYHAFAEVDPYRHGIAPRRNLYLLEIKLSMLKARRRDLVK